MIREIPAKFKRTYIARVRSRKAAIRSFCLECVGYKPEEVKECTDTGCPLYKWRLNG